MITDEPENKSAAAPDFRLDVKLRDVLVNSSEARNHLQSALVVEEGLPERSVELPGQSDLSHGRRDSTCHGTAYDSPPALQSAYGASCQIARAH